MLDQLLNLTGIARLYGVQAPVVANWRTRDPTFPKPLTTPGVIGIPLWDAREILAWKLPLDNYPS